MATCSHDARMKCLALQNSSFKAPTTVVDYSDEMDTTHLIRLLKPREFLLVMSDPQKPVVTPGSFTFGDPSGVPDAALTRSQMRRLEAPDNEFGVVSYSWASASSDMAASLRTHREEIRQLIMENYTRLFWNLLLRRQLILFTVDGMTEQEIQYNDNNWEGYRALTLWEPPRVRYVCVQPRDQDWMYPSESAIAGVVADIDEDSISYYM